MFAASCLAPPSAAVSVFSPLVEHAIELASEWHDQTYRKGRWRDTAFAFPEDDFLRTPVMAHLTTVSFTVQRAGWDEVTVAAAFLHDCLEDRNRFRSRWTYEGLRDAIGVDVADLVREVTEPRLAEGGEKLSWEGKKMGYVANLRGNSARAAAISLADKQHNLWNINQTVERGINVFKASGNRRPLSAGPKRQHGFYQAVLQATEHHDDSRLEPLRTALQHEIDRFGRFVETWAL